MCPFQMLVIFKSREHFYYNSTFNMHKKSYIANIFFAKDSRLHSGPSQRKLQP
ncbi:hypothetical protein Hanom_Chr16g01492301 [Helianthus anomalus]